MHIYLPILRVLFQGIEGYAPLTLVLRRPVFYSRIVEYPVWLASPEAVMRPAVYSARFTGVLDVDHELDYPYLDCYRAPSGDLEASFAFRCTQEQVYELRRFCIAEDTSSALLALCLRPDSSGAAYLNSMEVYHADGSSVSR